MKITRRQLRKLITESVSLLQEEEADCIRDLEREGYSPRDARRQCREWFGNSIHPLDADGNGVLTISEGPATSEMPAAWQQILGDLLDRK